MKILYLINYAGNGGTEKYVENLMRDLQEKNIPCGLCYHVDGPLVEKIRSAGMPVHRVVLRHPFDGKAAGALAALCRREGYDVIHAQYPRENCIALLARRKGSGAQVVFTSHLTIRQPLPWRVLNRLFTPKNKAVIAVCQASREILRNNGVCPERIRVIYNGIDATTTPPRNREALREFGIGEKEVVLITLARFMPEKGLSFLCQGLSVLRDRTEIPFRALLVGDGDELPAISQQIRTLGLEDRVILPGYRGDTGRLLAAADIYLNTSQAEAMSFAILEAMAAGLPTVATDVGGNPDLVHEGGDSGLTVPYGDVDALAQAMARLVNDRPLRQHLGQMAAKKAKTTFDLHKLLEEVYCTYQ